MGKLYVFIDLASIRIESRTNFRCFRSIMFYDKKLKKCGSTVYILKKVINCLVWHPESTAADTWSSPMKDYLAVASDSPSITILDISDLRKTLETQEEVIDSVKMNEEDDQQRNVHKTVAKLNGHSEKVVCLAWSPHFSGYLVSGSYDYTAQVRWTSSQQPISRCDRLRLFVYQTYVKKH